MDQKQTPEEMIAESISLATNFPKLCRQAVAQLGIYFDDAQYWWVWNTKEYKWQSTDIYTILNKLDTTITDSANTIDPKIKSMIVEALKREGRKNKPKQLDWRWIQFKSNLINFQTNETMKATKEYFIANPIPWEIGESDKTPVLDKMLDEWLNNDKMKKEDRRHVDYLKELFAFTMVPRYFISSVPFLYGKGGDGKTQFLDTIIKFIGRENEHSSTLYSLELTNFGTYDLRKKLMCSVYEVEKNDIKKFTNIKSISGRDGNGEISITKKNCQSVKEEVYSKFFLVGNAVPVTKDMSDGFFRRIIMINFPNRFKDIGDVFENIPDEEFENLALWCLNKLKELGKTYTLMADCDNLVDKRKNYTKISNQLIHFMESVGYVITNKQESRVQVTNMFNEFNAWADKNSHDILNYNEFKAKLQNLGVNASNAKVEINGTTTMRLFAYGVEKQPIQAKGN